MRYDFNDIMRVEVPRDGPFMMSDHYPLVAGRMHDGHESYIFASYTEDNGRWHWHDASGPNPEEACFMRRRPDGELILAKPSLSERLYVQVLRYDSAAYVHCEYYANRMRTEGAGKDSTEPFCWKFEKYLPAFYRQHANPEDSVRWGDLIGEGYFLESAEDDGLALRDSD